MIQTSGAADQAIQVAVGVVVNSAGQILLTQRAATVHQGGLWEFPGGKCAQGESVCQTLHRELHEELGILVRQHRPLIQIRHQYPELQVVLQVYRVTIWEGNPSGCEGQPVCWVDPQHLAEYPMPAANRPIIRAIQLPDQYVITPSALTDPWQLLYALDQMLDRGIRLVQLRVFDERSTMYAELVKSAAKACRTMGADLMLNAAVAEAQRLGVDGVHLNSQRLWTYKARPSGLRWLAASCHSVADLQQAARIGVDFVVLSPVCATPSHPHATILGWERFAEWVAVATMPVYALGGMSLDQLPMAWQSGAQGIAGIRGLWSE